MLPNGSTQAYSSAGAHLPARAPRVSFQNGLLSISAENSTLTEIFNAVHLKTGASVELPATTSNDRVAANLGPAPANQVLATLLNGSKFDYVIMNAPQNPAAPQHIILREKTISTAANNNQPPQPVYQPPQDTSDENLPEPAEVEETPAPVDTQSEPQPNVSQPPNPAPKTPEQLLEELKKMQQQQQQEHQPDVGTPAGQQPNQLQLPQLPPTQPPR